MATFPVIVGAIIVGTVEVWQQFSIVTLSKSVLIQFGVV